jgi:hypothetical protein
MNPEQKAERKRILDKVFDFCLGEMAGKGCLECPVNECKVCDEGKGGKLVTMENLRRAEKTIDEVMQNG